MSELALRTRSERQLWAAPGGAHDKVVAGARAGLPMAIGVLAAFLVMAPLTMGGDVSFVLDKNKVEVAKERMRLQSATYRGEDAKGQPFALNAGSAVQQSSAEPIVNLNALSARLQLSDGPARLVADNGRYDMDTEQVKIDGPITFRGPDNYALDTSDATVDLKSRKLTGSGAVTGSTAQGVFSGNRLTADLESRTVRLSGNARLRITPGRTR
ncbi:MAG: LPS export ABC transporter periplasmic protein LptC [Pseudomonadota bacterium]